MVLSERAAFNQRFPGERYAQVSFVLRDGRRLASPDTTTRGDPATPLSPVELRDKFRSLADPVVGPKRRAGIEAAISRLTELRRDDHAGLGIDPSGGVIGIQEVGSSRTGKPRPGSTRSGMGGSGATGLTASSTRRKCGRRPSRYCHTRRWRRRCAHSSRSTRIRMGNSRLRKPWYSPSGHGARPIPTATEPCPMRN